MNLWLIYLPCAAQVPEYFLDLQKDSFRAYLSLVHSRFSTVCAHMRRTALPSRITRKQDTMHCRGID